MLLNLRVVWKETISYSFSSKKEQEWLERGGGERGRRENCKKEKDFWEEEGIQKKGRGERGGEGKEHRKGGGRREERSKRSRSDYDKKEGLEIREKMWRVCFFSL